MNGMPIVYLNPRTGLIDTMPVEMLLAYVPQPSHLHLEEAARAAHIRDEEAATNLMLSAIDSPILSIAQTTPEGCGFDVLAVEPPSLR